ncbi:hypothetical protein [Sabulibacter ruber]|uniref:hypothetical protein n=1 Tax=Sabulibacter ruber TaxID=2811901 RepID=UPI001A96F0E7|nr:hypothetical protein [Sabulibacter ruber]
MKKKSLGLLSFAVLLTSGIWSCEQQIQEKQPVNQTTAENASEQTVAVTPASLEKAESKPATPPKWALTQFQDLDLDALYQFSAFTKPAFLEGDFNGDTLSDVAFLVQNLKTEEKGLLILHQKLPKEYFVLGAGSEVDGMTNLDWIEIFEKIPKGESVTSTLVDEETGDIIGPDSLHAVTLKGEGIYTHLAEACGGGIAYWNKNRYEWLHLE